MPMDSFSLLRRDKATADRTREILNLPEGLEWSELRVEFGIDEPGTVILHIIPTGEQVEALAELAVYRPPSSVVSEDSEDRRPHSRACGWHDHPHGSQCAVDCPTCHT